MGLGASAPCPQQDRTLLHPQGASHPPEGQHRAVLRSQPHREAPSETCTSGGLTLQKTGLGETRGEPQQVQSRLQQPREP